MSYIQHASATLNVNTC